jgi:hypothetical protein
MSASDLRTEIVETQKNRTELVKWKLLLVAGLGTVSLGLGEKVIEGVGALPAHSGPPIHLLALIPLVCLYVDVLCYHQQARILVIGYFLLGRTDEPFWQAYEILARAAARQRAFSLEDWALSYSTRFFSILVVVVAIIQRRENLTIDIALPIDPVCFWIAVSGVLGLVLSFSLSYWFHKHLVPSIRESAQQTPLAPDPY